MRYPSFRSRLRAFQTMRQDPPDPGFVADLEFLENRDLDLSVRLGAMLAFNALLIALRGIMLGEEFDSDGLEADDALRQRLFAAFIHSIDAQARLLGKAVRWSLAGGSATLLVWAAILAGKML